MALLRISIIGLVCIIASEAHAVKGGGGPGGTGFTCGGLRCSCDGSYTDCKDMEKECRMDTMKCSKDDTGRETCHCVRKSAMEKPPTTKVPLKVKPSGVEQPEMTTPKVQKLPPGSVQQQ